MASHQKFTGFWANEDRRQGEKVERKLTALEIAEARLAAVIAICDDMHGEFGIESILTAATGDTQ